MRLASPGPFTPTYLHKDVVRNVEGVVGVPKVIEITGTIMTIF